MVTNGSSLSSIDTSGRCTFVARSLHVGCRLVALSLCFGCLFEVVWRTGDGARSASSQRQARVSGSTPLALAWRCELAEMIMTSRSQRTFIALLAGSAASPTGIPLWLYGCL